MALDASDAQLDFPIVYASAREGWTAETADLAEKRDMGYLLSVMAKHVPPPRVLGDADAPFRMLVTQMDADQFIGKMLIGRVMSGRVRPGDAVNAMDRTGKQVEAGACA